MPLGPSLELHVASELLQSPSFTSAEEFLDKLRESTKGSSSAPFSTAAMKKKLSFVSAGDFSLLSPAELFAVNEAIQLARQIVILHVKSAKNVEKDADSATEKDGNFVSVDYEGKSLHFSADFIKRLMDSHALSISRMATKSVKLLIENLHKNLFRTQIIIPGGATHFVSGSFWFSFLIESSLVKALRGVVEPLVSSLNKKRSPFGVKHVLLPRASHEEYARGAAISAALEIPSRTLLRFV